MQIGSHILANHTVVAPMAGVTDRPFRQLCKHMGAALAVSEMVSSDPRLYDTRKSRLRTNHDGEVQPVSAQVAGADPEMMAQAARYNVAQGAQIVDINMGCPAKKVCNVHAGSALLRDEPLVGLILDAVVAAVDVPVTLKIRTGWDHNHRNAVRIARLAQVAGVRALTVHGRTRACGFSGEAEYDTIGEVKAAVTIPVIANGDIDSAIKARAVLRATGADAVIMIGRAAQGRPWIFRQINHYLATGHLSPEPTLHEVRDLMLHHVRALHTFYGEEAGVRVARKHIGWYIKSLPGAEGFRRRINEQDHAQAQLEEVERSFLWLNQTCDTWEEAA